MSKTGVRVARKEGRYSLDSFSRVFSTVSIAAVASHYLHGLNVQHEQKFHAQEHVRVLAVGQSLGEQSQQQISDEIAEFVQLRKGG